MHDEDAGIIQAVRDGDTEAFRLLVDRHKDRLYVNVLRQLGDPLMAEEITQDVFVKAYTGLPRFRGESSFGTWLIQIGIFAVRDHLRYRGRDLRKNLVSLEEYRRQSRPEAEPVDTHPDADPEAAVLARETDSMTRRTLADLPDSYREIIALKHGENLSYEEIAGMTGDSVGTLKVRAYRARTLLRRKLLEIGWEESASDRPRTKKERDHV